jgi:hypothetical protein
MRFSFIFLGILLTFASCITKMKIKTKTVPLGGDCDKFNWCDGNLACNDYRCTHPGALDNQVAWGVKCDWFHHCADGKSCFQHRCQLDKL